MDDVKAMIAQAVQHHMVTGPDRPRLPEKPDEVLDTEGRISTPLVTMIRVKTLTGIRLFEVRVKEVR